ncbi:AmmeMemoRadiSam system protein B [Candidatus Ozemobacteraceae bacterium]|nr:AmmeMemoRadiSam system protein B [Candidatus Ozemobacteraceae bacterium]
MIRFGRVFRDGFLAAGMLALSVCAAQAQVRPAAMADLFYPGDPAKLETVLDGLFGEAGEIVPVGTASRLVGLIAPHAGYQYSGPTAAKAFKAIAGQRFDRVYVLGLDHRSGRPTISVWPEGAFDTPLGPVPADAGASRELLEAGVCIADPDQHAEEHSIEVVLPFLIKAIGLRPSVFLSLGGPAGNGSLLGRELVKKLSGRSERILLVASTDWSHYHDAAEAEKLDTQGLEAVRALDPDGLREACEAGRTELCGLNGVTALLTVMKAASATVRVIERTDSSHEAGPERVVGYAAVVFEAPGLPPALPQTGHAAPPQRETSKADSQKNGKPEDQMNEFHREALSAVRTTLEAVLSGKGRPALTLKSPRFAEKCGVFVTLKIDGDLRGCIGLIEGRAPLSQGIQDMAIAAATEDPRFPVVEPGELAKIDIEISVLSPMIPVSDLAQIQVGRDGLLLRKYPGSGLLLPQVPTEYGWDRDTFLNHLCLKAGLPPGSHLGADGKSLAADAKLWRFTAEVFGEKEE